MRCGPSDHRSVGLISACGFDHLPAELDDGKIALAENFLRPVGDLAHGEPHHIILIGNARNAGEVAELHCLPVLLEIVLEGPVAAIIIIDVDADLGMQELAPFFRARRRRIVAEGQEIEVGILVIDRHMHDDDFVVVIRWDQHRIRRDEQSRADVVVALRVLDWPTHGGIAEAERCTLRIKPW